MAIPLYLILTLTVVDLSRLVFQRVSLQYVANQIIRDAVTICDADGGSAQSCPLIDNTGSHAHCRSRNSVPGGYLTQADLLCYGAARAELLRREATSMLAGFSLRVDPAAIEICKGDVTGCTATGIDAGLPEDLITVTIRTSLRPIALMWLPLQIPITVRVVGKNEPYFGT